MKQALLFVALIVIFASCESDSSDPAPPEPTTETVVLRDVDYIHDKYFYFDDPARFIGPRLADAQILVFRTVLPQEKNGTPPILFSSAWIIPDSVGDGQSIRDAAAVLNANRRPQWALAQDVELLTLGEDYRIITEGPTLRPVAIELTDPIPDTATKALAVSYVNMNDVAVGGSYSTLGVNRPTGVDTLILEMIKAPDPRPFGPFGTTWKLELRNVYNLGWSSIEPGSLKVVIEDVLDTTRQGRSRPQGSDVRYIQIFGLDTVGKNGSPPGDGIVEEGNFDFERNTLWFPSLHPFAPDPDDVNQWTGGQFAFTGEYQAQYATSKFMYEHVLNATQTQEAHQYDIRVTRTMPAP